MGREVEGQSKGWLPYRCGSESGSKKRPRQRADDTGPLGNGEELGRRDMPKDRAVPARQCFKARSSSIAYVDDRLEHD
ncbi:hypothetical protein D3C71_1981460 [compost metagenome]